VKSSSFVKIIAVWLVAWLPLSAAMATAMPIYAKAPMVSVAESSSAESAVLPDAQDVMQAMPCHAAAADTATMPANDVCSHCVLCHIAGAMVPPTVPEMATQFVHDCPTSDGVVAFTSFIPPTLQRPPSSHGAV
jgi:hypothetical protein